jgi:beta-alanine--pyruvate transaminase
MFGSRGWGVKPDIMCLAKGISSGYIPLGATVVNERVEAAFAGNENFTGAIMHGYTYAGHPVACAAALAVQDIYQSEGLLTRAAQLAPQWEEAVHSLRDLPNVIDIRNVGLIGGIELAPRPDAPGARGYEVFVKAFEKGILVRLSGDVIALSPPLIIEPQQIDELITTLAEVLRSVP